MTANAKGRVYHYDLMQRNRETIREQTAELNRTIQTLHEVARSTPPPSASCTEEGTRMGLCVPSFGEIDQRLKLAFDAVDAESMLPPARKYA